MYRLCTKLLAYRYGTSQACTECAMFRCEIQNFRYIITFKKTGGFLYIFIYIFFIYFYVLYSTLLHLPPLRFHCVGGCYDRTQDCATSALAARRSNHLARSHPYYIITLVLSFVSISFKTWICGEAVQEAGQWQCPHGYCTVPIYASMLAFSRCLLPILLLLLLRLYPFLTGICGEAVQEAGGPHREVRGEGDAAGARLQAHG